MDLKVLFEEKKSKLTKLTVQLKIFVSICGLVAKADYPFES